MSERHDKLTRRQVVQGALATGAVLGVGPLVAACGDDNGGGATGTGASTTAGRPQTGGRLRVGIGGGGSNDTLDGHRIATQTDFARGNAIYDTLTVPTPDQTAIDPDQGLAETIEPYRGASDEWIIRLREGVTFHDGKPLTPEDVIFSLRRRFRMGGLGGGSLGYVDLRALRKLDDRTVLVPLQYPNVNLPWTVSNRHCSILPVGYDPERPVGTGPFRLVTFTPGEEATLERNVDYWQDGRPHVDELVFININDESARMNALRSGQVDVINDVPTGQRASVESGGDLRLLAAQTHAWPGIVMRTDRAPFDDVRVRLAMKLLINRQQVVDQALAGEGRIGNDMYAPGDPLYPTDVEQREQDIEQARSLLRQAGQSDLHVEIMASDLVRGMVDTAQVLSENAREAGVTIDVRRLDVPTFYAEAYLQAPFTQTKWNSDTIISLAYYTMMPGSSANETHWENQRFIDLIIEGAGTLDEDRRGEILGEAMRIHRDEGGYIVSAFLDQIDAHSANVEGLEASAFGRALGDYNFRTASISA